MAAGYNKHFGQENYPQQTVSAHCDWSEGRSLLAGTDQGPVMCTRGGGGEVAILGAETCAKVPSWNKNVC